MRSVAISTVLLLSTLAAAPAAAQPRPNSGTADSGAATDEADALFNKGKTALTAGKAAQAYDLFLASWRLKQTHDIAGNLAQVELLLGKKRDAAEHIAFALAHFPPTVQSDRREGMKKVLDGLRKDLGTLRIQVSVADAKVTVDGTPVGSAPLAGEVFVEPGPHVVDASLAGYSTAQAPVDAAKGSSQKVALTLVKAQERPPQHDGKGEPGGPRKPVVITGAVLGGIGVVLGAVFAGLSNASASDVATKHEAIVKGGVAAACGPTASPDCEALQSSKRDQVRFANASAWSFIVGGALGAATVIYALAAPRTANKSGMRVVPLVAADGGGVMLRGEW